MISPPSPELTCVGYRMSMKENLSDIPTEELEDLVRELSSKKPGSNDYSVLSFFPNHDVFICGGAIDVLRERCGEDYVDRLLNLRRPRTFNERLRTLLFNELFTSSD